MAETGHHRTHALQQSLGGSNRSKTAAASEKEGPWTLTWINIHRRCVRRIINAGVQIASPALQFLGAAICGAETSRTATDKESRARLPNNEP